MELAYLQVDVALEVKIHMMVNVFLPVLPQQPLETLIGPVCITKFKKCDLDLNGSTV